MITLLQKASIIESSYDEEDSHYFLENIQKDIWYSYSSKEYPIDTITSAIESFISHQATVDLPDQAIKRFWTQKPIGAFRYKMLQDGSWASISSYDKTPGFLVQGSYWTNGFYYLVSNQDFLIEANLYIDLFTKEQYNYQ
jgi:hypothetical protein